MGAWAARGDTHAGSIASSGVAWSRVRACPQYLWLDKWHSYVASVPKTPP